MYDEEKNIATDALKSSSTAVFTDDTISKILALTTSSNDSKITFDTATPDANGNVTIAAGTELLYVDSSDTAPTNVTLGQSSPVVVFQGKGGVSVVLNDGPSTVDGGLVSDRVVVGTAGSDRFTIADNISTRLILGSGNDTIFAGGGESTIIAGMGNATIQGGSGHSIVELKGNASDYTVSVDNGHAIVTHVGDHLTTDISKIQFVQLDSGKALIFANDEQQAAVTTLYETAFGRTADAGGLQYWFDRAAAGDSLNDIAEQFTMASEFAPQAGLSNADFVKGLYLNTFDRAAEADGLAYWTAALETGGASRAQLIKSFSQIAAQSLDGGLGDEATIVGSVTIVHNII